MRLMFDNRQDMQQEMHAETCIIVNRVQLVIINIIKALQLLVDICPACLFAIVFVVIANER